MITESIAPPADGLETKSPAHRPARTRSSRVGKIARLPWKIREALNRRLRDGESARNLAAWLNELPECQAVLRRDFAGRPVNEQNLSDWKYGGFGEWLAKREADDALAEMLENPPEPSANKSPGKNTTAADEVARWFFPHYVALARGQLAAAASPGERWEILRRIFTDLSQLRRSERHLERLRIWQAKLELPAGSQRPAEQKTSAHHQRATREETERAVRQILGIRNKEYDQTAPFRRQNSRPENAVPPSESQDSDSSASQ